MVNSSKKYKTLTKKLFILFIVLQPFLDIYFFYVPPLSKMLSFSVPTIIRILFIFIIGLLFVFSERNHKMNWFILGYGALLLVYFVLHVWNAKHFYTFATNNLNYSTAGELFYLVRMIIPLFVILLAYQIKINRKLFLRVIVTLTLLVSGSIVLTDLFGFALASYGSKWINGNFFSWFNVNTGFTYWDTAAKSFFYYANAVSALELLLAPIVFYYMFTTFNWRSISLTFIHIWAMFILGTKTATFGVLISIFGSFGLYFLFRYFRDKQPLRKGTIWVFIGLVLFSGVVLPFSPTLNRQQVDNVVVTSREGSKKTAEKRDRFLKQQFALAMKGTKKDLAPIIKNNYVDYGLQAKFVEGGYSYKIDPMFWYDIMTKWPAADRANFRKLEEAQLKRVKEINHNHWDDWLGITYTRMNHVFNLERDFVSQWYSMGYLGVLLLVMPYVFLMLYGIYLILKQRRELMTYWHVTLLFGVVLVLAISFYSGNVLDFLSESTILAFIEGYFISSLRHGDAN
ncbi:O-antigen ligase family protein [Agrilactobacillus fermenti]|uniref:O-antigen ligase family protein n=1 Tax=Agrilactobacillus fermenti TaxID=2586909 RepID=UPI001E363B66|nr:O-antigen ligase family protein [Agrilactobacillus fermenti]MCD2255104.1 O-antigen ligase family protein [Agrilactobacillus fermenti]